MRPIRLNKNLRIIILLILTIVIGYLFLLVVNQKLPVTTQENLSATYKSSAMDFYIMLPSSFKINEEFGQVKIINSAGTIYITRNGTNFNNLKEYLADLDSHNNPKIIENRSTNIQNKEANIRIMEFNTGEVQKSCKIFSDNWIYNIYTDSEPLFDELDQIANSFQYTP